MTTQAIAIQTTGLSKRLGGREVLRGIDLEISKGECVALRGGNGDGKTTLLRCLAAIARPTSGTVRWFGRPAAASPDQRRQVGLVGHESQLYGHLTVRENLLFAARMCGAIEPARRVDRLLDSIDLRSMGNRQVRQISQGMRQRVALARAVVHDPPIWLLDEPFSGLDRTSCEWLVGLLSEQQAAGRAVCFATHDEEHSRQLAVRTLWLRNGSLVRQCDAANASTDNHRCCSAA